MKQRIFLLVFGSCIGIGMFLYSVFSWYSGILSISQTPPKEVIRTTEEKTSLPPLSLEEKFGQMLIIGFDGTEVTPELSSLFSSIRPGGVLLLGRNIAGKEQTKKLIADLQDISVRVVGLPLFIAVDQEGGIVSRVPWVDDTSPSALRNADEALLVGKKRAQDLREVGVNMNLAPVLDSNGENDFLFNRSFQEDRDVSFSLAQALIQGHTQEGVIPVPKHFPGYDRVDFNPETGVLPLTEDFPDTSFFKDVMDFSQVPFLMLSHVVYEAVDSVNPLPLSEEGMDQVRKELGDQVLFMSDDLASKSLMAHYSLGEIGRAALNSGVNILLIGGYPNTAVVGEFYQAMRDELAKEQLSSPDTAGVGGLYEILSGALEGSLKLQERVEESADKIIRLKQEML
jgi:beta-N-acetylhexosaminidase